MYIKINKENYFFNLSKIKQKVGSKDKIAVVLKDNAYGHGLIKIANLARDFGIKRAVVKSLHEAFVIQDLFDYILVLSEIPKNIVKSNISIAINSLEDLPKV